MRAAASDPAGRAPAAGDAPASAPGVRVEARELSRYFGGRCALDRLSLGIAPGESFGLLGRNGAGKTTFLRLLTGYLLPSSGELFVDGVSPAQQPRAVQERLGFVMETTRLYPGLGVESFLRFAGGARGLRGDPLDEAVAGALERFGLASVARRMVGNLSKGYQQRVSLAQALLGDPALLIVDEPTTGLDPVQRDEVHEILRSLRGRRTTLVCSHDLEEARRLTERVAVLDAGRLVAQGPTAELLQQPDPLAVFRTGASAP